MVIIGIDPGVQGAIVMINEDGEIISIQDIPTLKLKKGKKSNTILDMAAMANIFRVPISLDNAHNIGVHVFIEKAQPMPARKKGKDGKEKSVQGISSTFKYGMAYGILLGQITAFNMALTPVHPRTWKKAMMPDMDKSSKDASRYRAMQLFPSASDKLARKKDEHRAEALLIAEYGRRQLIYETI